MEIIFDKLACLVGHGVLWLAGGIIVGYILFVTIRFLCVLSRIRQVEKVLREEFGLVFNDTTKKFESEYVGDFIKRWKEYIQKEIEEKLNMPGHTPKERKKKRKK